MNRLESRLKDAKRIIIEAAAKGADFSYFILSDGDMEIIRQELMRRKDFRGREAEKIKKEDMVNVLSFSAENGFAGPVPGKKYLGEVYLNRDFTGYGKPDGKDRFLILGPLLVHGFLHLLGYRHYLKRDRIIMEKKEKDLWDLISSSDSTSAHRPSRRLLRKSKAAG